MIAPKRLVQSAFHNLGLIRLVRFSNRNRLRILMYHRFPAGHAAAFERQCAHIAQHYHPLSLTEAGRLLQSGAALPENALAVTIDDGYRDCYQHALPPLAKYQIPATVFLTTGFLDGLTWLWWDLIRFAFEQTAETRFTFQGTDYALRTPEQREAAIHPIVEHLTRIPNQERLQYVAEIPLELNAVPPAKPTAEFEPLLWDEVREMARHGFDFGAHTVMHPILSRIETDAELRWEIETSRDRVAQELGRPTLHFCYPSGRAIDLDGRARQLAEASAFNTAVTTETGFNTPAADRLLLRRVGVEPGNTPHYFAQQLAGFRVPG